MTPRLVAPLALSAGLLASLGAESPARAACLEARRGPSVARLPEAWQVAVDQLIRSTAEPGHPWSCAGGTIELTLDPTGGVLRVALEGDTPVARHVTSPEDVVPLGQALLATPLAPSREAPEPSTPEATGATAPEPAPRGAQTPVTPPAPGKPQPRLLVSGGLDARHVGASRATWLGPAVSAAVPMGRWLPSISFRQQSSVLSGRGGLDELSVAVAVHARFDLPTVEWRVGLSLRAAAVERQLPDRQGEQGRREGRVGAGTSLVIPAFRWGSVVVSADAERVAFSHEQLSPAATLSEGPRPFPTYTLGGSALLEVPL